MAWEDFGRLGREAQGDVNRPLFANLLGSEWLPAITDVERLQADPPARIADVACGAGWSSIAIARAYPRVSVDGYDLDEESVALARQNVDGTEVADRVNVQVRDAGDPEQLAGSYQLSRSSRPSTTCPGRSRCFAPCAVLAADDGAVMVMDERVAETFTAPGDEIERVMYTYSVLCCLPVGLADTPSRGRAP